MRYTVSFAVFLYAASAIIDVVIGVYSINQFESYLFKIASVAMILATYIYLISKEKILRPIPFIGVSLLLSGVAIMHGRTEAAVTANIALKAAAVLFTLKPEIIMVEIISEEEGESQEGDKDPSSF